MTLTFNKLHIFIFLPIFFLPFQGFTSNTSPEKEVSSIHFNFYNENINVNFYKDMIIPFPMEANASSVDLFYHKMNNAPYHIFLNNLHNYKDRFQLNDWLFYELIRQAVDKIYEGKNEMQQTLSNWFLLTKLGYDTRLTLLDDRIFLYVYSNENIFETPMIEDDGKFFINLTSIHNNKNTKKAALRMLPFEINPQGKAFSFDLTQLPNFQPNKSLRKLEFDWNSNHYELEVLFDQNLVDVMAHYPIFEEQKYIKTPLSDLAAKSLLPQLKKILDYKTEKEALEIFAAFTRSAFQYKNDNEYFGKNKPMIADELFHYPYSDCEDRSALYYFLVKELLHLPMIVIAYDDHLTIAVASSESIGNPIWHNGKKYYFCDPTGPSNSAEVGKAPKGYERKNFEVLK